MSTSRRAAGCTAAAFAAALTLAVVLAPKALGAPMPGTASDSRKTLVILGASYAGSWGAPPLPGYRIVNRGIGGDRTEGMLRRFSSDVAAVRPDTVLIWGHVNNLTSTPPEQVEAVKAATREHYLDMLAQARAAGIEVILATEIPLAERPGLVNGLRAFVGRLRGKQSFATRINVHLRELNGFVRDLAARERLQLLDFEKVFAPNGGVRRPEFAAQDGSHITEAGYDALTEYAVTRLMRRD